MVQYSVKWVIFALNKNDAGMQHSSVILLSAKCYLKPRMYQTYAIFASLRGFDFNTSMHYVSCSRPIYLVATHIVALHTKSVHVHHLKR